MNIVGTHLAEHSDSEERAQELRTRLARDNAKWDQVCESAAAWQAKLQLALIQVFLCYYLFYFFVSFKNLWNGKITIFLNVHQNRVPYCSPIKSF